MNGRPNRRNKSAFSNSSGFRDVLLWTEGLTVEIRLRFQIPQVFVTDYCGRKA